MKFTMPHEFEIPDEWWSTSGMSDFQVAEQTYRASSSLEFPTIVVSFDQLIAPHRKQGVQCFDRDRMINVLRGIVGNDVMPPCEVDHPPTAAVGQLRIRDGYHRFYASIAVGFTHLPVSERPFFDIGNYDV